MRSARPLDVAGTVVRLGLAAVWLVSGIGKLADPLQAAVAVDAYEVLPAPAVPFVATVLPLLELALGALLLLGVGTRLAAVVSALLLVGFVIGLVQAWARGLSIDCGCFGGGGPVEPGEERYLSSLLRDLGFLGLAVWLSVRPRTLLAVDRIGHGRTNADRVPDESVAGRGASRGAGPEVDGPAVDDRPGADPVARGPGSARAGNERGG
ncbi:MauE/DoxX family redox-associated membrane protein [Pseudonocardia sp. NPDC049635]|uniref:MauE/DoxX family redox-associated membrane protein n=1 Tax=Pseudonocardia sp. NPDC049635 TaxID=3155506 RepID=UPI00340711B9